MRAYGCKTLLVTALCLGALSACSSNATSDGANPSPFPTPVSSGISQFPGTPSNTPTVAPTTNPFDQGAYSPTPSPETPTPAPSTPMPKDGKDGDGGGSTGGSSGSGTGGYIPCATGAAFECDPTTQPSTQPSSAPSASPSATPTSSPSATPSTQPSGTGGTQVIDPQVFAGAMAAQIQILTLVKLPIDPNILATLSLGLPVPATYPVKMFDKVGAFQTFDHTLLFGIDASAHLFVRCLNKNGANAQGCPLFPEPLVIDGATKVVGGLNAAINWYNGNIEVFAVNDAGHVLHWWWNAANGEWSNATDTELGHVAPTSTPAMVSNPDTGRFTVLVRNDQEFGVVRYRHWSPSGGWSAVQKLSLPSYECHDIRVDDPKSALVYNAEYARVELIAMADNRPTVFSLANAGESFVVDRRFTEWANVTSVAMLYNPANRGTSVIAVGNDSNDPLDGSGNAMSIYGATLFENQWFVRTPAKLNTGTPGTIVGRAKNAWFDKIFYAKVLIAISGGDTLYTAGISVNHEKVAFNSEQQSPQTVALQVDETLENYSTDFVTQFTSTQTPNMAPSAIATVSYYKHLGVTAMRGGSGGGVSTSACADGKVAVGLAINSGADVDNMGLVCASLNYTATELAQAKKDAKVANGSAPWGTATCAGDKPPSADTRPILVGATVWDKDYNDHTIIGMVRLQCAQYNVVTHTITDSSSVGEYGGNGESAFQSFAPQGSVITAIFTRVGERLDAVGFGYKMIAKPVH